LINNTLNNLHQIIHISIDPFSENDKIYFPEDSTDSDSANDEEKEECYDKLEIIWCKLFKVLFIS
jgi:hypothetical protein